MMVADGDLYNRYLVTRRTKQRSVATAFGLVLLYFGAETISNLGGCMRSFRRERLWISTGRPPARLG
jgi:hypothetical protein